MTEQREPAPDDVWKALKEARLYVAYHTRPAPYNVKSLLARIDSLLATLQPNAVSADAESVAR